MFKHLAIILGFTGTISFSSNAASLVGEYQGERLNEVTITFNTDDGTNHGKFSDGETSVPYKVRRGVSWGSVKNAIDPTIENSVNYKGYPILDSTHTFSGWKYDESSQVFDNYCFDKDTILNCKWNAKITSYDFSNNTWEEFCQVADDGYENLKTKYNEVYTTYGNTFIIQNLNDPAEVEAKTRTVNINGNDYKVRVIGENHDCIKGNDKVAALTFEFVDVFEPNISYDYSDTQGHQSWGNSSIREYLNKYLLPEFPSALVAGMKNVVKKVDDGNGELNRVENEEKLFLLSREEALTSKVGDTDERVLENSYYQFYKQHNIGTKQFKNNNCPYWLRSPSTIVDGTSKAYAMNSDGTISKHSTKEGLGICPVFAVGETKAYSLKIKSNAITSGLADDKLVTPSMPIYGTLNVDETKYDLPSDVNVTINGEPCTKGIDYTYEPATGEFTIPDINFIKGDIVITKDLEASAFKSDSWGDLIATANEGGLNKLKEKYDTTSFIGKRKSIVIDGKTYWTRVIGENTDVNATTSGQAPLTFEFEDLKLSSIYDTTNNNNFISSKLNELLDGENGLASKFPFSLNAVKKSVATFSEDRYSLNDFKARLFPLSNVEIGGTTTSKFSDFSEGKVYSYYKDSDNSKRVKYANSRTRTLASYWTRSPITDTDKQTKAINVNTTGALEENAVTNEINVFPAFAIGNYIKQNTLSFKGYYLKVDGESSFEVSFNAGSSYSFKITANDNYRVSSIINVTKKVGDNWVELKQGTDYIYKVATDEKTADVIFNSLPDADVSISSEGHFISTENWDNTDKLKESDLIDSEGKPKEVNSTITFDGISTSTKKETYTFRLIGVDHDDLYVEGQEKGQAGKIHTTWEMVNCFSDIASCKYDPTKHIDGSAGTGWKYSIYRNFLQSENAGGFMRSLSDSNPTLYKQLKCAAKTTVSKVNGSYKEEVVNDWISCLSLADIFNETTLKTQFTNETELNYVKSEGTQYIYYAAKLKNYESQGWSMTSIPVGLKGDPSQSSAGEWWYTRTGVSKSRQWACAWSGKMSNSFTGGGFRGCLIFFI